MRSGNAALQLLQRRRPFTQAAGQSAWDRRFKDERCILVSARQGGWRAHPDGGSGLSTGHGVAEVDALYHAASGHCRAADRVAILAEGKQPCAGAAGWHTFRSWRGLPSSGAHIV